MIRIAFGFQARCGKDTAADFLVFKYGGEKFAFADPLKEIRDFAQETLGIPNVKDRAFLQFLGDWAKKHDPNIFVTTLTRSLPGDKNVYVSDVRFKQEFDFLRSQGFLLIRIKRKGVSASTNDENINAHESEHSLHTAPWDYVLKNNGTREELFQKLCDIVHRHFTEATVVKSYGRCVCCSSRSD